MNQKILSLSNQIRASKKSGDKFVLMLGAGASFSSGVKPTDQIMTELLAEYGPDIKGTDTREKFDQLWRRLTKQQKTDYLGPYLGVSPSKGYEHLATLILKGYVDTIITFNFDRLLQIAMRNAGLNEDDDFKVIVGGDHDENVVVDFMEMREPRIKILKLHGSLTGTTFLWTEGEMALYPPAIENLVKNLTKRPILVCGYAFQDSCMVRAFAADGGPIYYVNPAGASGGIRGFMSRRESTPLVINGSDGKFDSFFGQLATALEPPPKTQPSKPSVNPFKYLASYEIADADCFFGRDEEAEELISKIEKPNAPFICIMGPSKCGKTSLLRAGALAHLDEEAFEIVPLRCRGSLEQTLPQLRKWLPEGSILGESGVGLLEGLAHVTTKHVVVVLDQFERVLNQQKTGDELLRKLVEKTFPNLTVVCVITDEQVATDALLDFILLPNFKPEFVRLKPMLPEGVGEIVQRLAARGNVTFAPEIIEEVKGEYEGRSQQQRFTLAHVQVICHLLCEQDPADIDLYRRLMQEEQRATLDLAINRYDIMNFIEDVSDLEERSLLRDLIRLVSHAACNEKIVDYVQKHVCGKWAVAEKGAALDARAATASAGTPGSSTGPGQPEVGNR